jgi:hypothetical protein
MYLYGSYSYIYAALEALIVNHLHSQIQMLHICINEWDSLNITWSPLLQFTNLKLLYFNGNNTARSDKYIPDITLYLPISLVAFSIVNMPYYNNVTQVVSGQK